MRRVLWFIIIVIAILCIFRITMKDTTINDYLMKTYDLPENCIADISFEYGHRNSIENEKQAIEFAASILIDIYGESVTNTFPLRTIYDDKFDLWVMEGNINNNEIGGVPYICISANNGDVVYVSHSK